MLQVQACTEMLEDGECAFCVQVVQIDAAKTLEKDPAKHGAHSEDPFTILYDPGWQASQLVPSGPLYPMLQMHIILKALRAAE